eukprot:134473_1
MIDNSGFFSWTSNSKNLVFADFADYNINIYVVKHINYTRNDSYIPIIIRFCKLSEFEIDLKAAFSSFNEIGYPIKIWISKQSTIADILKQYFGQKYENILFKICWSRIGELLVNDVIYDKISKSSIDNQLLEDKMKRNQLLIILAPVTKQTSFFSK